MKSGLTQLVEEKFRFTVETQGLLYSAKQQSDHVRDEDAVWSDDEGDRTDARKKKSSPLAERMANGLSRVLQQGGAKGGLTEDALVHALAESLRGNNVDAAGFDVAKDYVKQVLGQLYGPGAPGDATDVRGSAAGDSQPPAQPQAPAARATAAAAPSVLSAPAPRRTWADPADARNAPAQWSIPSAATQQQQPAVPQSAGGAPPWAYGAAGGPGPARAVSAGAGGPDDEAERPRPRPHHGRIKEQLDLLQNADQLAAIISVATTAATTAAAAAVKQSMQTPPPLPPGAYARMHAAGHTMHFAGLPAAVRVPPPPPGLGAAAVARAPGGPGGGGDPSGGDSPDPQPHQRHGALVAPHQRSTPVVMARQPGGGGEAAASWPNAAAQVDGSASHQGPLAERDAAHVQQGQAEQREEGLWLRRLETRAGGEAQPERAVGSGGGGGKAEGGGDGGGVSNVRFVRLGAPRVTVRTPPPVRPRPEGPSSPPEARQGELRGASASDARQEAGALQPRPSPRDGAEDGARTDAGLHGAQARPQAPAGAAAAAASSGPRHSAARPDASTEGEDGRPAGLQSPRAHARALGQGGSRDVPSAVFARPGLGPLARGDGAAPRAGEEARPPPPVAPEKGLRGVGAEEVPAEGFFVAGGESVFARAAAKANAAVAGAVQGATGGGPPAATAGAPAAPRPRRGTLPEDVQGVFRTTLAFIADPEGARAQQHQHQPLSWAAMADVEARKEAQREAEELLGGAFDYAGAKQELERAKRSSRLLQQPPAPSTAMAAAAAAAAGARASQAFPAVAGRGLGARAAGGAKATSGAAAAAGAPTAAAKGATPRGDFAGLLPPPYSVWDVDEAWFDLDEFTKAVEAEVAYRAAAAAAGQPLRGSPGPKATATSAAATGTGAASLLLTQAGKEARLHGSQQQPQQASRGAPRRVGGSGDAAGAVGGAEGASPEAVASGTGRGAARKRAASPGPGPGPGPKAAAAAAAGTLESSPSPSPSPPRAVRRALATGPVRVAFGRRVEPPKTDQAEGTRPRGGGSPAKGRGSPGGPGRKRKPKAVGGGGGGSVGRGTTGRTDPAVPPSPFSTDDPVHQVLSALASVLLSDGGDGDDDAGDDGVEGGQAGGDAPPGGAAGPRRLWAADDGQEAAAGPHRLDPGAAGPLGPSGLDGAAEQLPPQPPRGGADGPAAGAPVAPPLAAPGLPGAVLAAVAHASAGTPASGSWGAANGVQAPPGLEPGQQVWPQTTATAQPRFQYVVDLAHPPLARLPAWAASAAKADGAPVAYVAAVGEAPSGLGLGTPARHRPQRQQPDAAIPSFPAAAAAGVMAPGVVLAGAAGGTHVVDEQRVLPATQMPYMRAWGQQQQQPQPWQQQQQQMVFPVGAADVVSNTMILSAPAAAAAVAAGNANAPPPARGQREVDAGKSLEMALLKAVEDEVVSRLAVVQLASQAEAPAYGPGELTGLLPPLVDADLSRRLVCDVLRENLRSLLLRQQHEQGTSTGAEVEAGPTLEEVVAALAAAPVLPPRQPHSQPDDNGTAAAGHPDQPSWQPGLDPQRYMQQQQQQQLLRQQMPDSTEAQAGFSYLGLGPIDGGEGEGDAGGGAAGPAHASNWAGEAPPGVMMHAGMPMPIVRQGTDLCEEEGDAYTPGIGGPTGHTYASGEAADEAPVDEEGAGAAEPAGGSAASSERYAQSSLNSDTSFREPPALVPVPAAAPVPAPVAAGLGSGAASPAVAASQEHSQSPSGTMLGRTQLRVLQSNPVGFAHGQGDPQQAGFKGPAGGFASFSPMQPLGVPSMGFGISPMQQQHQHQQQQQPTHSQAVQAHGVQGRGVQAHATQSRGVQAHGVVEARGVQAAGVETRATQAAGVQERATQAAGVMDNSSQADPPPPHYLVQAALAAGLSYGAGPPLPPGSAPLGLAPAQPVLGPDGLPLPMPRPYYLVPSDSALQPPALGVYGTSAGLALPAFSRAESSRPPLNLPGLSKLRDSSDVESSTDSMRYHLTGPGARARAAAAAEALRLAARGSLDSDDGLLQRSYAQLDMASLTARPVYLGQHRAHLAETSPPPHMPCPVAPARAKHSSAGGFGAGDGALGRAADSSSSSGGTDFNSEGGAGGALGGVGGGLGRVATDSARPSLPGSGEVGGMDGGGGQRQGRAGAAAYLTETFKSDRSHGSVNGPPAAGRLPSAQSSCHIQQQLTGAVAAAAEAAGGTAAGSRAGWAAESTSGSGGVPDQSGSVNGSSAASGVSSAGVTRSQPSQACSGGTASGEDDEGSRREATPAELACQDQAGVWQRAVVASTRAASGSGSRDAGSERLSEAIASGASSKAVSSAPASRPASGTGAGSTPGAGRTAAKAAEPTTPAVGDDEYVADDDDDDDDDGGVGGDGDGFSDDNGVELDRIESVHLGSSSAANSVPHDQGDFVEGTKDGTDRGPARGSGEQVLQQGSTGSAAGLDAGMQSADEDPDATVAAASPAVGHLDQAGDAGNGMQHGHLHDDDGDGDGEVVDFELSDDEPLDEAEVRRVLAEEDGRLAEAAGDDENADGDGDHGDDDDEGFLEDVGIVQVFEDDEDSDLDVELTVSSAHKGLPPGGAQVKQVSAEQSLQAGGSGGVNDGAAASSGSSKRGEEGGQSGSEAGQASAGPSAAPSRVQSLASVAAASSAASYKPAHSQDAAAETGPGGAVSGGEERTAAASAVRGGTGGGEGGRQHHYDNDSNSDRQSRSGGGSSGSSRGSDGSGNPTGASNRQPPSFRKLEIAGAAVDVGVGNGPLEDPDAENRWSDGASTAVLGDDASVRSSLERMALAGLVSLERPGTGAPARRGASGAAQSRPALTPLQPSSVQAAAAQAATGSATTTQQQPPGSPGKPPSLADYHGPVGRLWRPPRSQPAQDPLASSSETLMASSEASEPVLDPLTRAVRDGDRRVREEGPASNLVTAAARLQAMGLVDSLIESSADVSASTESASASVISAYAVSGVTLPRQLAGLDPTSVAAATAAALLARKTAPLDLFDGGAVGADNTSEDDTGADSDVDDVDERGGTGRRRVSSNRSAEGAAAGPALAGGAGALPQARASSRREGAVFRLRQYGARRRKLMQQIGVRDPLLISSATSVSTDSSTGSASEDGDGDGDALLFESARFGLSAARRGP